MSIYNFEKPLPQFKSVQSRRYKNKVITKMEKQVRYIGTFALIEIISN